LHKPIVRKHPFQAILGPIETSQLMPDVGFDV
jgi:hypothetical protein